jgi:uncharacterized protein (DUF983 family)
MTYAELQAKMSNQEFELWMALAMARADECPNCGREPREMTEWITHEIKCPICDHEYEKVRSVK